MGLYLKILKGVLALGIAGLFAFAIYSGEGLSIRRIWQGFLAPGATSTASSVSAAPPRVPVIEREDGISQSSASPENTIKEKNPSSTAKKNLLPPLSAIFRPIFENPPVALPEIKLPATLSATSSSPAILEPKESVIQDIIPEARPDKAINSQSIVGLSCYFRNKDTGEAVIFDKGTGVIIDPEGYILTSRHLVDFDFAAQVEPKYAEYAAAFDFLSCDAGQIPTLASLPAPDLIRTINPFIRLPFLGYRAYLEYAPDVSSLSGNEREQMDFVILKIKGVTEEGKTFGILSVPSSFPFADLAEDGALKENDEVLTYGFPGDVSIGMNSGFGSLYLLGSVGRVTKILGGDKYFLNKPFIINTKMSVSGGRSGSPVFLRGDVAGIITAYKEGDTSDSFSLSIEAIREFLPPMLKN